MRNGANFSRRRFLKGIVATALLMQFGQACREMAAKIAVRLTGTRHVLGHRLWAKDFPKPSRVVETQCLIVGGGISGLSAARQFVKRGISDFLVLEMEEGIGGNSSSAQNKHSKYPLGAHYLPLPNADDAELISFLRESGVITGNRDGYPEFDPEQLCFDPDERLFYRNRWTEGLIPKDVSSTEHEELTRFFKQMEAYRVARGTDGKYLFDIPLDRSSSDTEVRSLDKISFEQWLKDESYSESLLFEHADYCCRDDFGFGIATTSAWAGIHYFAGRKFDISPNCKDTVLTWPEGNARLASHLSAYAHDKTLKNHLAFDVKTDTNKVSVFVFDAKKNESIEIKANRVIMATPQFVNGYLIPDRRKIASGFSYAPWLLATLTVSELRDNSNFPLCWDNVIHGAKGLGYIYDQHQSLAQVHEKKVITYYRSFPDADTKKSRRELLRQPEPYWKQQVFDDLKTAHPEIESVTESIHLHRLGHGMIGPRPGFIWGETRQRASVPIDGKIYFAHSDLSGISVFEEAFHQGINAVNRLLDETTLD